MSVYEGGESETEPKEFLYKPQKYYYLLSSQANFYGGDTVLIGVYIVATILSGVYIHVYIYIYIYTCVCVCVCVEKINEKVDKSKHRQPILINISSLFHRRLRQNMGYFVALSNKKK